MRFFIFLLLMSIPFSSSAQKHIDSITYTYFDVSGKIISKGRLLLSQSFYNNNNNGIVRIKYFQGKICDVIIYEYDDAKHQIGVTEYNDLGKIIDKIDKEYDKEGKLIPISEITNMICECKNKDDNYLVRCKYDMYNNIIFFEKKSKDGLIIEKYDYVIEYR